MSDFYLLPNLQTICKQTSTESDFANTYRLPWSYDVKELVVVKLQKRLKNFYLTQ
jgi:hypothetical protein